LPNHLSSFFLHIRPSVQLRIHVNHKDVSKGGCTWTNIH
jgi:hypothetical protein